MTGSSEDPSLRDPWAVLSAHVPGSGHLERGIPCQDRAEAWSAPRPCLLLLDGSGSAPLSHVGAAAALDKLRETILQRESDLKAVLDIPGRELASVGWKGLSLSLYHAAASEQLKLAGWYAMNPGDFEFTLTLAIFGREHIGWFSVGDSPLVARVQGVCGLVSPMERTGFANQTSFVSAHPGVGPLLQGGLIDARNVEAMFAMSDGSASRLLDLRGQIPSPAVLTLTSCLAAGCGTRGDFLDILRDPSWDQTTRDDRSLAIIARRLDGRSRNSVT